jgi:hypothetical protein
MVIADGELIRVGFTNIAIIFAFGFYVEKRKQEKTTAIVGCSQSNHAKKIYQHRASPVLPSTKFSSP